MPLGLLLIAAGHRRLLPTGAVFLDVAVRPRTPGARSAIRARSDDAAARFQQPQGWPRRTLTAAVGARSRATASQLNNLRRSDGRRGRCRLFLLLPKLGHSKPIAPGRLVAGFCRHLTALRCASADTMFGHSAAVTLSCYRFMKAVVVVRRRMPRISLNQLALSNRPHRRHFLPSLEIPSGIGQ